MCNICLKNQPKDKVSQYQPVFLYPEQIKLFMKDFTCLSDGELIEELAVYTSRYTAAFKGRNADEELNSCKRIVDSLVDEICKRNAMKTQRANPIKRKQTV